jgi:hypothetical protein
LLNEKRKSIYPNNDMKNLALAALSIAAILLTPAIASAYPDRNWNQDRVIIYGNQNRNLDRNWSDTRNQNRVIIYGNQNRNLDRNWHDRQDQNRVIILGNQNRDRFSYENRNRYESDNYRNDFAKQRYYQELERRRLYENRNYNDRPIFGINLRIGQ